MEASKQQPPSAEEEGVKEETPWEPQYTYILQRYVLGNVTKSQAIRPLVFSSTMESIMWTGKFQRELALLLLDFGQNCNQMQLKSLESICLEYLARHGSTSDEHTQSYEQQLPKHLQQKIKMTKLTQLQIGAWAGDRLIITGDLSNYSPFPPDGKWKSGNLYDVIDNSFAEEPYVLGILYDERSKESLDELTKLCEDKLHFVVNLDLKEYLDPQAYDNAQKNVLHFVRKQNRVMAGLVIKLAHSTGSGGEDLSRSITSQGTWAGCRVKICTAEDVEDFEGFKDVSNPEDVSQLITEEQQQRLREHWQLSQ